MLTDFAARMVETGGVEGVFLLSLALIIGHVLGDYPLQGTFLATGKNRHADADALFSGMRAPKGLWLHALTAHALIQAGMVWLISGSHVLGLIEFALHWVTDYIRCEGWISFSTDQLIHMGCKVAFALLLVYGVV